MHSQIRDESAIAFASFAKATLLRADVCIFFFAIIFAIFIVTFLANKISAHFRIGNISAWKIVAIMGIVCLWLLHSYLLVYTYSLQNDFLFPNPSMNHRFIFGWTIIEIAKLIVNIDWNAKKSGRARGRSIHNSSKSSFLIKIRFWENINWRNHLKYESLQFSLVSIHTLNDFTN